MPQTMPAKYWSCRKCAGRWPRTAVKCRTEGCTGRRPKRRVPVHARTLRDDTYERYAEVSREAHGVTDESCCVCGRPRHESMHHHRDHDHVHGTPRGIVCFQCNKLMPRLLTLERAREVTAYLERAEVWRVAHYREETQ